METKHFYTQEEIYQMSNKDDLIEKRSVGLPLNFSFMARGSKRFFFGLGAHANYNKTNSVFGGHLKFDFHLNK